MDGFDRLLAEFGESIGIPQMAFDQDGLCHIRVDEEYPITFRRDDEHHNLVLVGLIAEHLPEQMDSQLVRDMLATGVEPLRDNGAALGLEPMSGTLILHQTMPLAKIDRAMLEQVLGNFILMQKDWSARVAGGEAAPNASGAGADADTPSQAPLPPLDAAGLHHRPRPKMGEPAGTAAAAPPATPVPPGTNTGKPAAPAAGGSKPAGRPNQEPRFHPHLHHR